MSFILHTSMTGSSTTDPFWALLKTAQRVDDFPISEMGEYLSDFGKHMHKLSRNKKDAYPNEAFFERTFVNGEASELEANQLFDSGRFERSMKFEKLTFHFYDRSCARILLQQCQEIFNLPDAMLTDAHDALAALNVLDQNKKPITTAFNSQSSTPQARMKADSLLRNDENTRVKP